MTMGKLELERLGAAYRAAYLAHDPARAPIDPEVRFTENHVEMAVSRWKLGYGRGRKSGRR